MAGSYWISPVRSECSPHFSSTMGLATQTPTHRPSPPSNYCNHRPPRTFFCVMSPRKKEGAFERLKKRFKPSQPSESSPAPTTCPNPPPPATASPLEPDPCATAATSSECPPTPEQHPVLPLRDSTAPSAADTAAETDEHKTSGPHDCLRPLSQSEIHKRTYDALTKRLTSEELQRVGWKKYEGTADKVAKNIEDLKETLGDKKQHSETMNNILQYINKYCTIVDVAIQHHPDITALVWAGARTLIQVSRTLNNASSKRKSHSLPSWRPIAMKPL